MWTDPDLAVALRLEENSEIAVADTLEMLHHDLGRAGLPPLINP